MPVESSIETCSLRKSDASVPVPPVRGIHARMRTLDVTKLRDLTGPGITDEYGIGGTDLGAATTAPDGRIVAVFGDTFESREAGGPGWRSPVILFGDPGSVRSGLMWNGTAGPSRGYADQVVSYRHNARIGGRLGGLIGGTRITTQLPTDLLTVGDTMYLHVMACEGLGNVHWTEIHRSRDNGVSWESTGLSWPGGHLGGMFQMLTWELGPDGYVYALSTGFQRDKGLLLQRVHADHLLDAAAWEGWGFADGAWGWGNPPTPVLPGAFGELSLRRVGGHVVALRVRRRELPHRPHPDARRTDDRPHHRRAPHGRLGLRVGRGGPRLRARGPALRRLHPARLHAPTRCTSSSASGTPTRTGRTGRCTSAPVSPSDGDTVTRTPPARTRRCCRGTSRRRSRSCRHR